MSSDLKRETLAAVHCKQCIESTHLSARYTTYRSPNGLQLAVCPVFECSRLSDRCRATSYRVLDTQHTLWACGHSSTIPGKLYNTSNISCPVAITAVRFGNKIVIISRNLFSSN